MVILALSVIGKYKTRRHQLKSMNNKSFLVTGGTGFFGKKFIETILQNYEPRKIIVYSRDELKQFEMRQKWPDNVNLV